MVVPEKLKHLGVKGQGYFCIVKKYIDEADGKEYAVKELKKDKYSNQEYRYRLLREIRLLNELQNCKNIIQLISYGNDEDLERLWYIMPLAESNLFDFIRKNSSKLTLIDKFNIVSQIIDGIKFAHEKNILHRDISPNNALVFRNNGEVFIQIADFGLGKDTESLSYYTGSSTAGYGQILYVAPEQRKQLNASTVRSDVYSLGKLIYFIFTNKDPDNLKPFELSTLVTKATEENPEERFESIEALETHFNALRNLQLNQVIPVEYITLSEFFEAGKEIDFLQLHQLLVKGNYINHVYDDYIAPVNSFLLEEENLVQYYSIVGNAIREFAETYSLRLDECYQTVRWPFAAMSTFGKVLKKIIKVVSDDLTRLICLKQLWHLAFEADQWSVQNDVKEVYTTDFISNEIENQLAYYIVSSETKIDIKKLPSKSVPQSIKLAVIKGNAMADERANERLRERGEIAF